MIPRYFIWVDNERIREYNAASLLLQRDKDRIIAEFADEMCIGARGVELREQRRGDRRRPEEGAPA